MRGSGTARPVEETGTAAVRSRGNAAATSEAAIEGDDSVPIFPDTTEGRTARLAYYEARKLNNLPYSGYDYTDAKRGEPQYGSAKRANGATAVADDQDRQPERVARTS